MDDFTQRRLRLLEFQSESERSLRVSSLQPPSSSNNISNDTSSESDLLLISGSGNSSGCNSITSNNRNNNESSAKIILVNKLLDEIGSLLHTADKELDELQNHNDNNNNMLGSALHRQCQELADIAGHVAEQLEEQQRLDDNKALTEAYLQDFDTTNSTISLRRLHNTNNSNQTTTTTTDTTQSQQQSATNSTNTRNTTDEETMLLQQQQQQELLQYQQSNQDIAIAIRAAAELLRDVESALRDIQRDEADDIADAALATARIFVLSLQQVHKQITNNNNSSNDNNNNNNNNKDLNENPNIEFISEQSHNNYNNTTNKNTNKNDASYSSNHHQPDRVRCLWPPIGPAVAKLLNWTKDEIQHNHWILTAALGITLWPVAVITAIIGTPTIIADNIIQHCYNTIQNGPIIATIEVAAAQVVQTTKLALLTTRAIAKPTIRIVHRQCTRHAPGLFDWTIHKITNPITTIVDTTNGLLWCSEQLIHTIQNHIERYQQEQELQKQEL